MLMLKVIEKLLRQTGLRIKKSTLEYYDRVKLIVPKRNSKNNYRDYTEKDYNKVKLATLLKDLHYPLRVVNQIVNYNNYSLARQVLEDLANKTDTITLAEIELKQWLENVI